MFGRFLCVNNLLEFYDISREFTSILVTHIDGRTDICFNTFVILVFGLWFILTTLYLVWVACLWLDITLVLRVLFFTISVFAWNYLRLLFWWIGNDIRLLFRSFAFLDACFLDGFLRFLSIIGLDFMCCLVLRSFWDYDFIFILAQWIFQILIKKFLFICFVADYCCTLYLLIFIFIINSFSLFVFFQWL